MFSSGYNYFFSYKKAPQPPDKLPKQQDNVTVLKAEDFVDLKEEKTVITIVEDFVDIKEEEKPVVEEEKPVVTIHVNNLASTLLNNGPDLTASFTQISEYQFQTAYSKSLNELAYNPNNPIDPNSSHKVFKGTEITTGCYHFIKEVNRKTPDMPYIEAFNGQLYKMLLLYGFTEAYVRVDFANPFELKTSSKGITDFKTFADRDRKPKDPNSKDLNPQDEFVEVYLTKELLEDVSNRRRFNKISAVVICMKEDDFHRGNLTRPYKSSPGLQMFDADCANWGNGTWLIKGPAKAADQPYGLRDPILAFLMTEKDVLLGPNFVDFDPRYFPSRPNPYRKMVEGVLKLPNNTWTPEENEVVKALIKDPNTLSIYFETYIDWMIDISERLSSVAALNIPSDLKVRQMPSDLKDKLKDDKVITLYVYLNKITEAQYWSILPNISEFQNFLENNTESILKHILIRSMIRNDRLTKERDELLSADEEKLRFASQFDAALQDVDHIIFKYNKLIAMVSNAKIIPLQDSVSFANYHIPQISKEKATALIDEAKSISNEMIELENTIGTENWKEFEKFDYQFKPVTSPSSSHTLVIKKN